MNINGMRSATMGGTEGIRMSEIGKDSADTSSTEKIPPRWTRRLGGICVLVCIAGGLTSPVWATAIKDQNTISRNRLPALRYTGQILQQTIAPLQRVAVGEVVLSEPHTEDEGCDRGTYLFDPDQWRDAGRTCAAFGGVRFIIPHGAPGDQDQQYSETSAVNAAARKSLMAAGFQGKHEPVGDLGNEYEPTRPATVGKHSLPVTVYLDVESGRQYNDQRSVINNRAPVASDAVVISMGVRTDYFNRAAAHVAPYKPGDD